MRGIEKSILALVFPSKTSAEIAPDRPKTSGGGFRWLRGRDAETRISIEVYQHWWYRETALGKQGIRFPLPAPERSDSNAAGPARLRFKLQESYI